MKLLIVLLATFSLSACYVDSGLQGDLQSSGDSQPNSSPSETPCEEYEYLRFELRDKNHAYGHNRTTGIIANIRIPKKDFESCNLTKLTVCLEEDFKPLDMYSHSRSRESHWNEEKEVYSWAGFGKYDPMFEAYGIPGDKEATDTMGIICDPKKRGTDRITTVELTVDAFADVKESDKVVLDFDSSSGNKKGKALKPYQDSQCFPKSTSQCEDAASGQ